MCETKHESVTSLIEERIRENVIRTEKEALEPLRLAIEAELKKLGIEPRFTSMPTFMHDMRCTHIHNQTKRRINALVDQIVSNPGPTQTEPAPRRYVFVGDSMIRTNPVA
ncbi:hypothetical protein LXA47_19815 [Massilia sp. P8910]|uniref:hypothetical protein n=1 Tax=Massilia antarctica TaxID=2765360 RepID=UPI001E41D148|nr:hypothetical protein [Massilia antarctica]MCE3605834.1 hypothetical protein [Massilia antarctica]